MLFFLFSYIFAPCPQSVGYGEHYERKREPHEKRHQRLGVLCLVFGRCGAAEYSLILSVGQLRHVVMAPLAKYLSFLEQQQSRVASDDCLQCCLVGCCYLILGPGIVAPFFPCLFSACCQADEPMLVFEAVFVDVVDIAEARLACLFQLRCYQQERKSLSLPSSSVMLKSWMGGTYPGLITLSCRSTNVHVESG